MGVHRDWRRCNFKARALVLIGCIWGLYYLLDSLPASNFGVTSFFRPPYVQHPIATLVHTAQTEFDQVISRQSQTFDEAVSEYRRRYGIDPPPHFDKWYDFVQEFHVPLVDEYDGIHELLRPFWGISPSAIRRNVKKALGSDIHLIAFFIRDGRIAATERGDKWKTEAIRSAIEPFAHLLPDMDLAFNIHDEARVIIPYDQVSQMNERGQSARDSHKTVHSEWSARSQDINSGSIEAHSNTMFLNHGHQFTWSVGTLSCSPKSPSRISSYENVHAEDDSDAYDQLPLGFVRNHTSFTDVCSTPSFHNRHSFFNMPNAFSVTHDPVPVFSPSKVSSFHDILYPAPWYLGSQVNYDEGDDRVWEKKSNTLYWRGSTTSGYSRNGTWHRQQRQRFVESIEKPGNGFVLEQARRTGKWTPREVSRQKYDKLFDVHFSQIKQCDQTDCEEQSQYFDVKPKDNFGMNWKSRFLLDIDGNAFSGRFYTFLQSYSLTLKQTIFREWHEDRVLPWVHYLPLGLNGTDHIEMMRYLTEDNEGQHLAQEMAQSSRKWAFSSLRHADMHAWMFRLLLEYGRLVDDQRQSLGFRIG